jgi:hypothetical protein
MMTARIRLNLGVLLIAAVCSCARGRENLSGTTSTRGHDVVDSPEGETRQGVSATLGSPVGADAAEVGTPVGGRIQVTCEPSSRITSLRPEVQKDGPVDVRMLLPVIQGSAPLTGAAGETTRRRLALLVQSFEREQNDANVGRTGLRVRCRLSLLKPHLVSILCESVMNVGGAHPSAESFGINLRSCGGRIEELRLVDVCPTRCQSALRTAISDRMDAVLRKEDAEFVHERIREIEEGG